MIRELLESEERLEGGSYSRQGSVPAFWLRERFESGETGNETGSEREPHLGIETKHDLVCQLEETEEDWDGTVLQDIQKSLEARGVAEEGDVVDHLRMALRVTAVSEDTVSHGNRELI